MRVEFTKIFAKNFRSIDNMGMEVPLDKSKTTLVTSLDNGQGKSTMIVHAIYFALFDKAFGADNKKSSLVNSRSNKDCVVEVSFRSLGSDWVVRRGIKPNLFDIEKNGVRIEDEAALKDYQAYLESIIGFNEKSFTNTVVLGRDKFVPFISMSAGDRRSYSEHMMDVVVFSQMNAIAKEDAKVLKNDISSIEFDLQKIVGKMDGSKRVIETLANTIADKSKSVSDEITVIEEKMGKYNEIRDKLQGKLISLSDVQPRLFSGEKHSKAQSMLEQARSQVAGLTKEIDGVESLESCPHCNQPMGDEARVHLSGTQKEKLGKLSAAIPEIQSMWETLEKEKKEWEEHATKVSEVNSALRDVNQIIQGDEWKLKSLKEIGNSDKEREQLDKELEVKEGYDAEHNVIVARLTECLKKQTDLTNLLLTLKDDGVKASIIQSYIPFLNQSVNEYLQDMNLFVNVEFDSEFDVTMFDPTRKGQTLGSLSSGQICRIDLAVLLAWRDIARAKSSADTNLLVFDEILESLSENGIQDFMNLAGTKLSDGVNLFVITQRAAEFENYFDDQIVFGMKDDHTIRVE